MSKQFKNLFWIGSSKEDFLKFSKEVKKEIGYSLYLAQLGEEHINVKPLSGFGNRAILEVVENDSGGTYRAVFTVRYKNTIYVLHAFKKKAKKGKATPKEDIDIIKKRLKIVEEFNKKGWA